MILGASLANFVQDGDSVTALTTVMGPLALIVVPIFAAGVAGSNAMNLYCGALSAITIVQTFLPNWRVRPSARIVTASILAAISFGIATLTASNFMDAYTNFLSLLLYVLVPWTAINLVDYYLVQHGRYDISAFFRRDGGIYGKFNGPALICYAVGILIQIPFMAIGLYVGPIAARMHDVDTSWIVGLLVVSPLYLVMVRRRGTAIRVAFQGGA
jgi:NCS1 family nucleobase:cation symporter-1